MFGVASDEGFDKRGLADSRRANDGDDNWRRLFRQTIDERDMETFLFDLEIFQTSQSSSYNSNNID